VVGGGDRLFGPTGDAKGLSLVDARQLGDHLVLVTYRVDRES
jgi:hypothetical protein